jgi:hypothetical protein
MAASVSPSRGTARQQSNPQPRLDFLGEERGPELSPSTAPLHLTPPPGTFGCRARKTQKDPISPQLPASFKPVGSWLDQAYEKRDGEGVWACNYCPPADRQTRSAQNTMQQHCRQHFPPEYCCDDCGDKFYLKGSWEDHFLRECPDCKKKLKGNLKAHIKRHEARAQRLGNNANPAQLRGAPWFQELRTKADEALVAAEELKVFAIERAEKRDALKAQLVESEKETAEAFKAAKLAEREASSCVKLAEKHRTGRGARTYPNGDKYNGGWKDGAKHGHGFYTSTDGWKYIGGWKDDKRNGRGHLAQAPRAHGGTDDGDWEDGEMTRGVRTYPNGNKYDGDFVDNKKHGRGVFTHASGNKYDGDYVHDKRNGRGVLTLANGNYYNGEWKDDERNGQGIDAWPDGSAYDGEWKDGERNGHGVFTLPDDEKYDGEWKDGKRSGHGIYTWSNGNKYDGEFKDGKQHGHGIYTWDGCTYDGEWKDDERNGQGIYTRADGVCIAMLYEPEDCPVCQEPNHTRTHFPCGHCICEACVGGMFTALEPYQTIIRCPMCRQGEIVRQVE